MVGKLVALYKGVQAQRGRMAICGVKPALKPIFTMVQLDKLVPFHPDAERVLLEWRRKPL
jgi:anti-anti-sigma regulatory factor